MPWVAAAVVGSSLIGADAAGKAANTQASAARYAADLQKQMFDQQNAQLAPSRAAGYGALSTLGSLGSGTYGMYDAQGNPIGQGVGSGYLQHQFNAEDLKAGLAPNYDFMLQQGQMANQRQANVGGGAIGGNALQGLQDYTQNYAGNAYQNAFTNYQNQRTNIYNTLAGIAGLGQNAQNTTANLAQNVAGNIGQATIGAANANAAGTLGQAGALAGGLTTLGNMAYVDKMQNQYAQGNPSGMINSGGQMIPVNQFLNNMSTTGSNPAVVPEATQNMVPSQFQYGNIA